MKKFILLVATVLALGGCAAKHTSLQEKILMADEVRYDDILIRYDEFNNRKVVFVENISIDTPYYVQVLYHTKRYQTDENGLLPGNEAIFRFDKVDDKPIKVKVYSTIPDEVEQPLRKNWTTYYKYIAGDQHVNVCNPTSENNVGVRFGNNNEILLLPKLPNKKPNCTGFISRPKGTTLNIRFINKKQGDFISKPPKVKYK